METVKAKSGQDAGNAVLGILLANARFEASVRSGAGSAGQRRRSDAGQYRFCKKGCGAGP